MDVWNYGAEVSGHHVAALSIEITLSTAPQTPIQFPLWPLVPLPERNGAQTNGTAPKGARHSPDFRSINWFGMVYSFTEPQSHAVRLLWESWQNGTPDVSDKTLIRAAESEAVLLRDVFKDHPAWGGMIAEGGTRGTHRLRESDD